MERFDVLHFEALNILLVNLPLLEIASVIVRDVLQLDWRLSVVDQLGVGNPLVNDGGVDHLRELLGVEVGMIERVLVVSLQVVHQRRDLSPVLQQQLNGLVDRLGLGQLLENVLGLSGLFLKALLGEEAQHPDGSSLVLEALGAEGLELAVELALEVADVSEVLEHRSNSAHSKRLELNRLEEGVVHFASQPEQLVGLASEELVEVTTEFGVNEHAGQKADLSSLDVVHRILEVSESVGVLLLFLLIRSASVVVEGSEELISLLAVLLEINVLLREHLVESFKALVGGDVAVVVVVGGDFSIGHIAGREDFLLLLQSNVHLDSLLVGHVSGCQVLIVESVFLGDFEIGGSAEVLVQLFIDSSVVIQEIFPSLGTHVDSDVPQHGLFVALVARVIGLRSFRIAVPAVLRVLLTAVGLGAAVLAVDVGFNLVSVHHRNVGHNHWKDRS